MEVKHNKVALDYNYPVVVIKTVFESAAQRESGYNLVYLVPQTYCPVVMKPNE